MTVSAEDFLDDKISAPQISVDEFLDEEGYQPDMVRTAYRGVMNNVAKPVNQAVSSGIGYALKGASYLLNDRDKQNLSDAVNYVKRSPVGVAVGEGVQQAKDELNDLSQYNTNLKADLSAFGQNAGLAGNIPILKVAGMGAAKIAGKVESGTSKLPGILGDTKSGAARSPIIPPVTTEELNDASTNAYASSLLNKEVFHDVGTNFSNTIEAAKSKPLPGGTITSENKAFNDAIDEFSSLNGQKLDIGHVKQIDEDIGQKIDAAFNAGNNKLGSRLMSIQDDFRDSVNGSRAGKELGEARDLYAAQSRARDLERLLQNAENYDNPSTYIRNGFRTILQNERRFKSYDKQTQVLIKRVAKGNITGDLLGIVGSRLNAIIGHAVGGPVGGVAANASSMAARGAKTALYANRGQKAVNSIGEQVRPLIKKYNMQGPVFQPPVTISGYLPAPTYSVNSAGQAATLAEREALGSGYKTPNPTIGEILKMHPDQANAIMQQILANKRGY